MINNINTFPRYEFNSPQAARRSYYAPNFAGTLPDVYVEKQLRKVEFFFRKLINKISDKFESNELKKLQKEFLAVDVNSEQFIDKLILAGRVFGSKKEVEINTESGLLKRITADGKSNIFIMNHDKQSSDPEMLAIFNTLLCQEYRVQGMAKTFPRPKIILNEDILLSMNPEKRKVFEKLGAVGIDADIYSNDNAKNARSFLPILKGLMKDNVNVFIFPEGKLAGAKVPLSLKFQSGVSEIVTKLTGKKDEVRVVPLGFAYNKGENRHLAGIHIGEPVIFKKQGEFITSSIGNIDSKFASENYKRFFLKDNCDDKVITDNGVPVPQKLAADYISGILSENLEICKKEAKSVLPSASLNEKVLIV